MVVPRFLKVEYRFNLHHGHRQSFFRDDSPDILYLGLSKFALLSLEKKVALSEALEYLLQSGEELIFIRCIYNAVVQLHLAGDVQ